MSNKRESPENTRERLRQEELKRNSLGKANDAFHRGSSGSLVDLVGSLGWKGTGILIVVIIIVALIVSVL
ncbi:MULTISPECIES: DUF6366 family protein [Bacillaceae]|uniref:DUF6366 family protein n=1 Tax=Bacillaceae TaxID=186817 RepID=UPI00047C6097|nr:MULTISPECIES: DUF6366 family protein [Bacillaceae]UOE95834.1 DUF6366 family protein [Alkalihalobacillus sp. LMS39]